MASLERLTSPVIAFLDDRCIVDADREISVNDIFRDYQAKQATIAENLLRISGEDDVNVERKNRVDWFGRLPSRFLMLSNLVPRVVDPSGALSGRFVMHVK